MTEDMILCQKNREGEGIIMTKKNSKKRKKSVEYSSLKTGNCKMSPALASDKCVEKQRRNDSECKNCWMNK